MRCSSHFSCSHSSYSLWLHHSLLICWLATAIAIFTSKLAPRDATESTPPLRSQALHTILLTSHRCCRCHCLMLPLPLSVSWMRLEIVTTSVHAIHLSELLPALQTKQCSAWYQSCSTWRSSGVVVASAVSSTPKLDSIVVLPYAVVYRLKFHFSILLCSGVGRLCWRTWCCIVCCFRCVWSQISTLCTFPVVRAWAYPAEK